MFGPRGGGSLLRRQSGIWKHLLEFVGLEIWVVARRPALHGERAGSASAPSSHPPGAAAARRADYRDVRDEHLPAELIQRIARITPCCWSSMTCTSCGRSPSGDRVAPGPQPPAEGAEVVENETVREVYLGKGSLQRPGGAGSTPTTTSRHPDNVDSKLERLG